MPSPSPTSHRPTDVPIPPLTEESRSSFSRLRIERIEANMKTHKLINSVEERRRIGVNLWQLLEDIEKGDQAVKKRDILRCANLGAPEDSTKRLFEYALNPTLPEAEQLRRAEKLAKKISRYADIARAAAKLCNRDPNEFIPDLVDGTRYSVLPRELKPDPKGAARDAWNEIVAIISSTTEALCTKYNLRDLFQDIITTGLDRSWSIYSRADPHAVSKRYETAQLMARPALVGDDDLPSRPSIFLGAITVHPPIPCEIEFDLDELMGGDEAGDLYDQLFKQNLKYVSLRARAIPRLVAHLDLLPHGKSSDVVPHLVLTSRTDFYAAEAFDGFSKATFNTEITSRPEAIKIDDRIGWAWGALSDGRVDFDSPNDFWYIWGEGDENYATFDLYATVDDDSLGESYAKSAHAGIPQSGSLLVALDAHAWEYLNSPVETIERPFCTCVYHSGAEKDEISRLEKQPLIPLFPEGTMLAAIRRSIQIAPNGSSLCDLLAKSVAEFAEKTYAQLREFTDKQSAEAERLQKGLDDLKELRKKIAKSYR